MWGFPLFLWSTAGVVVVTTMVLMPSVAPKAILTKEAEMWTAEGVLHLKFPVELNSMKERCEDLTNTISKLKQRALENKELREWQTSQVAQHTMEAACEQMDSWPSVLGSQHGRPKRQLLLGAAIGTMFGSFVLPEISSWFSHDAVQENVQKMEREVENLRKQADYLERRYRDSKERTMDLLQVAIVTQRFEAATQRMTAALVHLVATNRLTPTLLPVGAVRRVWSAYKEEMDPHFEPPYQEEVVYEVPASYELAADGRFYIYLHCPLLSMNFHLYHYTSFPISAGTGAFMLRADEGDLLAVNEEGNYYFEPSLRDITNCLLLGRVYVCQPEVIYSNFSRSCLAAIYAGLDSAVEQKCRRAEVDQPWVVAAGEQAGWYHLWTDRLLPYTVLCRNGTVRGGAWSRGTHQFFCSPGCSTSSAVGFSVVQQTENTTAITIVRNFNFGAVNISVSTSATSSGESHVYTPVHWTSPPGISSLVTGICVLVLLCWICCLYATRNKCGGGPFSK